MFVGRAAADLAIEVARSIPGELHLLRRLLKVLIKPISL
jgi:hypothetical protein